MNIGHIGVSVSNLSKSIAFYTKYFGLLCEDKYSIPEKGLTIALLKKGHFVLELFEFREFSPLPIYRQSLDTDLKTLGVKHFSVAVENPEKIYAEFKTAGIHFETGLQTFKNGAKYFFIKDPDGILIEIMEKMEET